MCGMNQVVAVGSAVVIAPADYDAAAITAGDIEHDCAVVSVSNLYDYDTAECIDLIDPSDFAAPVLVPSDTGVFRFAGRVVYAA